MFCVAMSIRGRIEAFKAARQQRNAFFNQRLIEGIKTNRAISLETIFKILPKLDLNEFLEKCIRGDSSGWGDGELMLAAVAEKKGLKPVKPNPKSRRYQNALLAKDRLSSTLAMMRDGYSEDPNLWKDYVIKGDFLDIYNEVYVTHRFFVGLMNELRVPEAEKWIVELRKQEPAIWRCVHKRLEEERGLRPDYSKAGFTPSE